MIKLWEFIIHGCWHNWRARDKRDLVRTGDHTPYGTRYTYQCEKCHRIKKLDVL